MLNTFLPLSKQLSRIDQDNQRLRETSRQAMSDMTQGIDRSEEHFDAICRLAVNRMSSDMLSELTRNGHRIVMTEIR